MSIRRVLTLGLALISVSGADVAAQVSETARRQIRQVEDAVRKLDTPAAALDAGFRPGLGWIPAMGEHWVNRGRMQNGFDMLEPEVLMFSPVNGKLTLVGVAYALRDVPDARTPAGFDGDLDVWHDHPALAAGDRTLHMLHVWFIDSPHGPFAGHNPWVSFLAAGVTPPDASRLTDPAKAQRIGEVAAALATTVSETLGVERLLGRFMTSAPSERVALAKDSIRALVPALSDAQRRGDDAEWDRVAAAAAAQWNIIRDTWLDAAPTESAKERLLRFLDGMSSVGAHHEHGARGHHG